MGFHLSSTIAFNCQVESEEIGNGAESREYLSSAPSGGHQLREMVPLADSTIYEMEQRGEFPRRFSLSSRCVVWDLAEVEAWLASAPISSDRARANTRRQQRRARPVKAAGSGSRDGIDGGIERRHVLSARDPGVNDVRPFLHHMPALNFVFGLVVDAP